MAILQNNKIKASNSNKILLEAKNLSHSFDYDLFKNINLTIHEKQSIAILGKSGSGKSTILNILSTFLKPDKGEINYKDTSVYKKKQKELLKIRREEFGIIFQSHYLFRGFSAIENLEIAKFLSHKDIDEQLLKRLEIDHVMKQGVGELSGGQQQRLSIARVLTKKPKVIFADEPTGNLDKQSANEVMNILFDYINENNAALVLVTHETDLPYMCDKVYKLDDLELKELK